jgi:hypothetical protein
MRRHANRQKCDLGYDCDRQPSWTAPETVEINQQPVTRLAVRDQSGRLLGHRAVQTAGLRDARRVLPQAKVPPIAEFVCMKGGAALRRENQQLVKLPSTPDGSV